MGDINFDTRDFKKILDKLKHLNTDKLCREATKDVASMVVAEATQNTVVVTGRLKGSYFVSPVKKEGNIYNTKVLNDAKSDDGEYYFGWYEKGHRQEVGRYVPALGKTLKKPWVEGRFTLLTATKKVNKQAPKIIEARLIEHMK